MKKAKWIIEPFLRHEGQREGFQHNEMKRSEERQTEQRRREKTELPIHTKN